jgi:hypothetical protein
MSLSENFDGDGEGLVAAAAVFFRLALALGEAAGAAAGDSAGLAAVLASAFLRLRLAFGEPAGDSPGAGEAAVSLVVAVASAFFRPRCFAGDSPGLGDWAWIAQTLATPIARKRVKNLLVMQSSLTKARAYSQPFPVGNRFQYGKTGRPPRRLNRGQL